MPEPVEPGETPGSPDIFAQLLDIAKRWMQRQGRQRPLPRAQGKGSIKVRNGTGKGSASRMLRYRHECIATTRIASHVLQGVPIQDFTPEHRVREAPDFMLNRKQLAARLGVRDIDEAILIRATLLRDQAMFLQPGMGAGEVSDIYGHMMAIVLRNLFAGLTENQALRGANLHLGDGHVHILGQGIRRLHDLFVELADARCRPLRHQEFNVWNAQGHHTELWSRRMHTEMVAPRAGHVDMAILSLAGEFGAV